MSAPEFARPVPLDKIGVGPVTQTIAAEPAERVALCRRFAWQTLGHLTATATLTGNSDTVTVTGHLSAAVVQSCVATGDPVPATIEEDFAIRFVPLLQLAAAEEEIELGSDDLDVMAFDGATVDLGEAVAQTLALALDPYPRSAAAADSVISGDSPPPGPFAALKGLLGG